MWNAQQGSPKKPAAAAKKKKRKSEAERPPGFSSVVEAAETSMCRELGEDGEAVAGVVESFVRMVGDAEEDDAVSWSTYELVAPSQLIWSMRQYVMLKRISVLHAARAPKGGAREHHRCTFHTDLHGGQIMIRDEGTALNSGNGPTTVLSSASPVGEGVLSWTLQYDGGNSSSMIGLVKDEFGPNLDCPLDVPAWALCSAHGYEGQGYTRFALADGEQYRCIADVDLGTFKVWRVDGGGGEGELLLEVDDVDCAVSLALCTWNGARFSIVEDDDSANYISGQAKASKPCSETQAAKGKGASPGPALPLALTAGLAGVCALLRTVADSEQLVELAVSSVQAVVGVVGALQPQQMLGETDESEPLTALLNSVSTNAATRSQADPQQQALLSAAATGLVALAAAIGTEQSLLSAAEALKTISALVEPTVHPVLVELPAVALSLERSVRSTVGLGAESLLPEPRHDTSRVKVMVTSDVAPSVVCFASDGAYLYAACCSTGLYKLAIGADGDWSSSRVCAHNASVPISPEAWVCVLGTHVILRPDPADSRAVVVLDADTLTTVEAMTLAGDPRKPCALVVVSDSVLATVETCAADALDMMQDEQAQAHVNFEPEPEPFDETEDEAARVPEPANQDLVATAALQLDPDSGLVLHARQGTAHGEEELSLVSTTRYQLELHGMVMYGHNADGAEFGCSRTFAVVGSECKASKFSAGDKINAKKRPLGFQNFADHKFFPAEVVEVNEDGTLHVRYGDEHRPDRNLPPDMAKVADDTPDQQADNGDGKDKDESDSEVQLEELRAFFDMHSPVESKRLQQEYRERLLGSTPATFVDVCEEIEQRFGIDPRDKKKTKSAGNDEESQHFLQMAQVKKLVRTDMFDCLLTNELEVFRRSGDGKLGSPTKNAWQKLHFGEDADIVDIKIAADNKLLLFVAASGRIWFAGNRPGVEDDDSWVAQPEILPLPTSGGQAPAAKKKGKDAGAGAQAVQPQPGGALFGGGGFGGAAFGAPAGFQFGGQGGPFGGNPFGGGGFGAPAALFGAPAADAGFGAQNPKAEKKLEFKKVPLGSDFPDGWRLATVADVQKNLETSSSILLEWDIVELQDGKMAGSGYEWDVIEGNTEDAGALMLVKDDEELAASLSALVNDAPTATPVAVCCAAEGAKGIVVWDNGNITVYGTDSGHGELGSKHETTPFELPCEVASVAMGTAHSCFLLRDGTVWCCGNNEAGQCGQEPLSDDAPARCELRQVHIGQTAVAIDCGEHHTVVVGVTDTFCFGDNTEGQLGRDGAGHSLAPLDLPQASSVSCGRAHTLVKTDRGVYGFGSNKRRQLGLSSSTVSMRAPTLMYDNCHVANFGADCDFSWAACSEEMASFAERILVLPRRNGALAVRSPHRLHTVPADPPLEPSCQSVWLIFEDGKLVNQIPCPDDITWCAAEAKRDITWMHCGQDVFSIHPLSLQDREDTEAGRQALKLKAQPGIDISTLADKQRVDLRNLPVWLWSHIDVLSNATHFDVSTRASIPVSKMTSVSLYDTIRNQNNQDQGRIQYNVNTSIKVTVPETDGTPYLLTGISVFGGSSRMQASLSMKCSSGNRKIAHKWVVAGQGLGQVPQEKIIFDEPIKLESGVALNFSGVIGHDAGVHAQYQYYNIVPLPSKDVDGLHFKFDGHGNHGDWLQVGIAEVLFCVAPQVDESVVRLSKELWESANHCQTIGVCVEALRRSWDQALEESGTEQGNWMSLCMCSQALRRLQYALKLMYPDDTALATFGLTQKLALITSLMHIVESNAPAPEDSRDRLVSDCMHLWQEFCTQAFPDISERRVLTNMLFRRAFSDEKLVDSKLLAAFLKSTAQVLQDGVDFLELCDITSTGPADPLEPELVIQRMLQQASNGPLYLRLAAASVVTAIASSLALTVDCKTTEAKGDMEPGGEQDDLSRSEGAPLRVKVRMVENGSVQTVDGDKCYTTVQELQLANGTKVIASHPDYGKNKIWGATVVAQEAAEQISEDERLELMQELDDLRVQRNEEAVGSINEESDGSQDSCMEALDEEIRDIELMLGVRGASYELQFDDGDRASVEHMQIMTATPLAGQPDDGSTVAVVKRTYRHNGNGPFNEYVLASVISSTKSSNGSTDASTLSTPNSTSKSDTLVAEVTDEEALQSLEHASAALAALCNSALEAATLQLASTDTKEGLQQSALLQEIPKIMGYGAILNSDTADGAEQLMRLLNECSRIRAKLNLASKRNSFETATVESPHPYTEADVFRRTVKFEDHVQWCLVTMDERSRTCQPEDKLVITDEAGACVRIFSGTSAWPNDPFVVKGCSVTFELSTATDYIKAGNAEHQFGFVASCCAHYVYESSEPALLALSSFESGILFQLLDKVTTLVECDVAGSWLDSRADKAKKLSEDALFRGGLDMAACSDDDAISDSVFEDMDNASEQGHVFREFARDFSAMTDGTQGQRLAQWLADHQAAVRPDSTPEPEPESEPDPESESEPEPEPGPESKLEPDSEVAPAGFSSPFRGTELQQGAFAFSGFSAGFSAQKPPTFSMGLAAVPNKTPPRSKRFGKGEVKAQDEAKTGANPEADPNEDQGVMPAGASDMPNTARLIFCALLWHSGAASDALASAAHLKFLKTDEELPATLRAILKIWEKVTSDLSEAAPTKPNPPPAWLNQVAERAKFLLLVKSVREREVQVGVASYSAVASEQLSSPVAEELSLNDKESDDDSALGRHTSVPSRSTTAKAPPVPAPAQDLRATLGSMGSTDIVKAANVARGRSHGLSRSVSLASKAMAQKASPDTVSNAAVSGLQPSSGLTHLVCADSKVMACCTTFIYQGATAADPGQTDSPMLLKRLATESARVASSRLKGMRLLKALMDADDASPSVLYDCFWCLAKLLNTRPLASEHMLSGLWTTDYLRSQLRSEFQETIGRVACVLQEQANLIQSDTPGHDESLIRAALRCFRNCNFAVADHDFLEGSQVLSSIGQIERAASSDSRLQTSGAESSTVGRTMECTQWTKDTEFDVNTSSNGPMAAAVFDESTESFWEADAQDHESTIEVAPEPNAGVPSAIRLHIDNTRDADRKCTSISLTVSSPGAKSFSTSCKVPGLFGGWLMLPVPPGSNFSGKNCKYKFSLEGGGMDHQFGAGNRLSPRLRGMRLFGPVNPLDEHAGRSTAEVMADEAIQVFRSVARSVIFGSSSLIEAAHADPADIDANEPANGGAALVRAGSVNLREHVVSLLFSERTGKLPPLQSQVCSLIFGELQQETARMQSEVARNQTDLGNDTFTFELMSLVLALSGTAAGLKHLASLPGTIATICVLMQIGSPRLQRQAMTIIKRVVLENMTPAQADTMLKPRMQFVRAEGFGGLLLALVAHGFSGSVQLRSPGSPLMAVHTNQVQELRVDARIDWDIAVELIALISSCATNESIKPEWSSLFEQKAASALGDMAAEWADQGSATQDGGGAALWRATAALSVMPSGLAEKLSSGSRNVGSAAAMAEKIYCTNHDDGATAAVFRCLECGPAVALCAQCDTCLHLPRAARGHRRTVVQQQEDSLNVSINDANARVKTQFGVLAVDRHNGKAVCELKLGIQLSAGGTMCRFCQSEVPDGGIEVAGLDGVCTSEECRKHAESACTKTLDCGHPCGGIRDEETCLPCLHCADTDGLNVDVDDFCSICWTDNLGAAPCIRMDCGHVFHAGCVHTLIDRRWPGPAITFGFMLCPCCKAELAHSSIAKKLEPIRNLKDDIRRKAATRLKFEGKDKDPEVTDKQSKFFGDPEGYAMDKYNYYQCFKCEKPYFGGERQCGAGGVDSFNPEELICPGCAAGDAAQICPKHGTDFLEYKCRYCCSVAVWFCFGTTHFCEPCHNENGKMQRMHEQGQLPPCPCGPLGVPLPQGSECPIGGGHPPHGEEYALGCGVCRNADTF